MNSRLQQLSDLADRQEADAVLVSHLPDVRWACGFTGSNGYLLVQRDRAFFITDGRYTTQAASQVTGADIRVPAEGSLLKYLATSGLLEGCKRVVLQSDHLTLHDARQLEQFHPEVEWVPRDRLLVEYVARKTPDEIEKIRAAQAVTDEVFETLLDKIEPGLTEKELAAEITYRHLRLGADSMAFEPIVASGPNGALPHARPTGRAIRPGELIVLDFGCVLDGYASDMTRTVAVGEPGEEARQVYDVVRRAQQRAVDAARAGMSSKALDAEARTVIAEAGLGAYFTHSLGHGVGLQVHEWPRITQQVDEPLPDHAVVTIEPGVYLPDRFGVRIEDLVVLKPNGCEVLTRSTKALVVL